MTKLALNIEFTTYDGQPGSRPPIFDPASGEKSLVPHELDDCHLELMVIPAGCCKPLSMAFMLFYLGVSQDFEWCSKYSAKMLLDERGAEVDLDESGYISFPLQKGDRWAIWPAISLN